MNELTEKDHQLLVRKGITEATLNAQVARFKQGVPPIQLVKAAVIDDGILLLTKEDAAKYAAIYQKRKKRQYYCEICACFGGCYSYV